MGGLSKFSSSIPWGVSRSLSGCNFWTISLLPVWFVNELCAQPIFLRVLVRACVSDFHARNISHARALGLTNQKIQVCPPEGNAVLLGCPQHQSWFSGCGDWELLCERGTRIVENTCKIKLIFCDVCSVMYMLRGMSGCVFFADCQCAVGGLLAYPVTRTTHGVHH
jgi:hypothetical protein